MAGLTEADTCRKFVVPKLIAAGWENEPHSFTEQRTFTDGRIIVAGGKVKRGKQKRADYLLRYTRDFLIAVVEAKANYKTAGDGLQQAKEYAEILGLKFAYSTNGTDIIEFNLLSGKETILDSFPSPAELWQRLQKSQDISDRQAERLLSPYYVEAGRRPRYYQEIAINRSVQAILQGKKRVLLTMATGTGKTLVAFQICWKLWSSRWNRKGEYRRPKILYLADRSVLVDDPKDKTFTPFGEARHKIENGEVVKSREMYFALYQSIARDERRPGLYREYAPDFFDLIIVDECHRGSAKDESNWREILEYFEPAYQIGMTATPLREDKGEIPITEAILLERGKFSHRPRNDPRFFGGDHPWIQIGEIEAANKYIAKWNNTLNDDGLAISRKFPKGTVLISIAATIGAVGILGFDCCIPDSIVAATPKPGIESDFVFHYLGFLRTHLEEVAPQSAQKNINLKILSALPFPSLSQSEQLEINKYLDGLQAKVDVIKTLQAKTSAELDAMLPTILDKAFRGEL